VAASIAAWLLLGKPDLTMILNGALAGLVAITAPCAFVSIPSSLVIGLLAGVLVVVSVLAFDRMRIDDPVGAISVHLVCGVFGTLTVGLFAQDHFSPGTTGNGLLFGGGAGLLVAQVTGILAVGVFVVVASGVVWGVLRAAMGIRVPADEEQAGLDIGEHGISAYPEFHVASGAHSPLAAAAAPRVGAPAVERAR
jgi:Amt family ammonium transporter